jgi:hypothetical protein
MRNSQQGPEVLISALGGPRRTPPHAPYGALPVTAQSWIFQRLSDALQGSSGGIACLRGACVVKWIYMAKITIAFTVEELQALLTLADNQFFRMKYIDPKIPGHKERPDELRAAQSAVQLLQNAVKAEKGFKQTPPVPQRKTSAA